MATWKKVVVEDSAGHIAQTALKADKLSFSANQGPEVLFQTDGGETSSVNKGTGYQLLRMNSGATALEYTSDIVETRAVNQTIQGEKLFSSDVGLTKPSDATNGNQSVDSGRFRFKRSHWANSQANTDTLQMQLRQDTVDTNDVAKWEWAVGTPNSGNNNNTDAIFIVNEEGSATVNKYLTITGGQIRNSSAQACITLASSSGVDIGGDLKVVGNDIKGSADNVCITLGTGSGSNGITVAGDLTVSGSTTTVNSTELAVADKIIHVANGSDSASNATGAGMSVDTNHSAGLPRVIWTNGAALSGWGVGGEGDGSLHPVAVMDQGTDTIGSSDNSSGVGSFYFETDAADLWIRTA